MRKTLFLKTFYLLAVSLFFTSTIYANGELESKVKSAFIYKFISYVQWDSPPVKKWKIGVYKSEEMFDFLKELEDKELLGKKIEVSRAERVSEFADFNVLYLGNRELETTPDSQLENVLTITDNIGIREKKGVINFHIQEDKIRFEIDLNKAEKQNLNISSHLLKLAVVVR